MNFKYTYAVTHLGRWGTAQELCRLASSPCPKKW